MTEKKRILYIEDDVSMQHLIRTVLEIRNYEVYEALEGIDGLDELYDSFPNLVLLDLMMPCMDGEKFLKAVSTKKGFSEVPVICISAKRDASSVRQLFGLGVSGYIQKPVDFDLLFNLINYQIEPDKRHNTIEWFLKTSPYTEIFYSIGDIAKNLIDADLLDLLDGAGKGLTVLEMRNLMPHYPLNAIEQSANELEKRGFIKRESDSLKLFRNAELLEKVSRLSAVLSDFKTMTAFANMSANGVFE